MEGQLTRSEKEDRARRAGAVARQLKADFLHHLVGQKRMEPLRRSVCAPLGWLGRQSLLLYLLHQPVLYGGLSLVFGLLER